MTLLEWIIVTAIACIVAGVVVGGIDANDGLIVTADGDYIRRTTLDGHDYYKLHGTLTHSASCRACSAK